MQFEVRCVDIFRTRFSGWHSGTSLFIIQMNKTNVMIKSGSDQNEETVKFFIRNQMPKRSYKVYTAFGELLELIQVCFTICVSSIFFLICLFGQIIFSATHKFTANQSIKMCIFVTRGCTSCTVMKQNTASPSPKPDSLTWNIRCISWTLEYRVLFNSTVGTKSNASTWKRVKAINRVSHHLHKTPISWKVQAMLHKGTVMHFPVLPRTDIFTVLNIAGNFARFNFVVVGIYKIICKKCLNFYHIWGYYFRGQILIQVISENKTNVKMLVFYIQ